MVQKKKLREQSWYSCVGKNCKVDMVQSWATGGCQDTEKATWELSWYSYSIWRKLPG